MSKFEDYLLKIIQQKARDFNHDVVHFDTDEKARISNIDGIDCDIEIDY